MTLMESRRALMGAASKQRLVDTSATEAAFYIRKSGSELHVCGARANGMVKLWRDYATSTENFSSAAWTSKGLNSVDFNSPWTDSSPASRCKFGGSNSSPASSPTDVNLDDAYAYWQETGRIMFAGINTPFYGMSNIDGTLATPGWSG